MRRLILILALLACTIAVGAGCGGGDDDSSGDPLESALAYVPSGTPFAVAIDTDVEGDQYKALEKILGRFPGGGGIAQSLRNQLEAYELELRRREDELDRDQAAAAEREQASWRELAAFFEEGDARKLATRLVQLDPEEAARILRALDPQRASELVNALPAERYREFLDAYRAGP